MKIVSEERRETTEPERRAYLLGRAEEAVQARVEVELFERPEVLEELLALEQDLAEAFVRDALDGADRAAFARRLATDPRLQDTLRVIQALDAAPREARADAARPETRRGWSTRRWLWAAPALAALALLVLVPRDEFTAKGAGEPAQVELTCLSTCEPGGRVALRLEAPPARPYVAIFVAERSALSWLTPASDAASGRVPADGLWPEGVVVPASGPLDVYVVFSAAPLTRKAVAAAVGDDLSGSPEVTLIRRRLEPEAGE